MVIRSTGDVGNSYSCDSGVDSSRSEVRPRNLCYIDYDRVDASSVCRDVAADRLKSLWSEIAPSLIWRIDACSAIDEELFRTVKKRIHSSKIAPIFVRYPYARLLAVSWRQRICFLLVTIFRCGIGANSGFEPACKLSTKTTKKKNADTTEFSTQKLKTIFKKDILIVSGRPDKVLWLVLFRRPARFKLLLNYI